VSTITKPLRSKEERDHMVEQYLPLVRHVVARLPVTMPATLSRDDFFSVGVMGLMQAAAAYDPTRGASFKTFAYTAIRGSILDEIRKHDPVPRSRRDRLRALEKASRDLFAEHQRQPTIEELAEYMGVSGQHLDDDILALHTCKTLSIHATNGDNDVALAGTLACESSLDPGEVVSKKELTEHLARAISELPDNERHAVVLYHYENLYLKEIGGILGVTESRVSQILSRATERLQMKMRPREKA